MNDFYLPGHTYTGHPEDPAWHFRAEVITVDPEDGETVALGWRLDDGEWEPYAYAQEDWVAHVLLGVGVVGGPDRPVPGHPAGFEALLRAAADAHLYVPPHAAGEVAVWLRARARAERGEGR